MTQPGYPPHGGGGYGAPPGGGGYGAPPPGGGYGPPPGGGYGHGPSIPAPPPKKKGSPLPIILGVVGAIVLLAGLGVGGYFLMNRSKGRGLPVDAKYLPGTAKEVASRLIEASREENEQVKNAYLAAELGGQLCRPGFGNIATQMESIGTYGSKRAKELFFDKNKIAQVQQVMECGGLLAGTLDSPYQSSISFEDDTRSRRVAIMKIRATEIPSTFGFSKETFGGIKGFCRTEIDDSLSPNGKKTVECKDDSHAAFTHNGTWYIGQKLALEKMAKTVNNPKEELTASVAALKDAANETSGLPDVQLTGNPKSVKEYLQAPCTWAQYKSGQFFDKEFIEGCFPEKTLAKNIEEVDSKTRGAAFEVDSDYMRAGAMHGNVILVARDNDGAKVLEKDVNELVTDWKSHISDKDAKLVKLVKEKAYTRQQKEFAAVIDTFFVALGKMKVVRNGRVVRISYEEKLSAEDITHLKEADAKTESHQVAVAQILGAIQAKKPVPSGPLAKLVGDKWAAYLTGPAPDVKTTAKVYLTPAECTTSQNAVKDVRITDLQSEDNRTMYVRVKYAKCNGATPIEVTSQQKACLLGGYKVAADVVKCLSLGTPTNEPPESEFGDPERKK